MNMGNDQVTRLRLANAVDRELAELIARGYREPTSLDAVDKNRFDAFVLSFMRLNFQAWDRARTGLLDMREWDIALDYTGQLLSAPGDSVWWTENRDGFIDEFRGVIDESIREHTGSE